jgi:hypothetical protein
MTQYREEHVTTERVVDDPVVVDRGIAATDSVVHRGNPAPVIAAICIGLLILFLVLFGISRNNSDGDGGGDVKVTVPTINDDGAGGANDGGDDGADANTDTDTGAKTDTGTSGTSGTQNP